MIPAWAGIVGQDRALGALEAALAAPAHAYLFAGPPNVGKTTTAKAWARALFCRERTGCGSCAQCRAFDHGNYPDFHAWEPAGRTTSIEQVRELVRQAELAPYRGQHQVHLVGADTLSLAAANCLLKTLEEPSEGTVLVLLAPSAQDVLPTIVSRCRRVAFNLVPAQAIAAWLASEHGASADAAATAARRCGGRIGQARDLLSAQNGSTRLLETSDALDAFAEADRAAALPVAEQLQLLDDLTLRARDALVLRQTGRSDWVDQPDVARRLLASERAPEDWRRIVGLLTAARARLELGASAKLAWTVTASAIDGIR